MKIRHSGLMSLMFIVGACSEPGAGPVVSRDSIAPSVRIEFPDSAEVFDRNGNGFVDLTISWSDNLAIDPATATLRAIGDSAVHTDLSQWDIVERTSAGMRMEEKLDHLLRGGPHAFEVAVRDTAGNLAADTVRIELPASQFWKTIQTNRPSNWQGWPVETAFCDNGRAYVASGTDILVIDAARAELIAVVPDPYAVENLQTPLCVPGDSLLYVTPGGEQLRLQDHTWRLWPTPGNLYGGIAQSRVNPDLLYAGEHYTADIAVLRRSENKRLGRLGLPRSEYQDRAFSLAVMPGDEKIYSTRALEGGILVSDPHTGKLIRRIAPDGTNTSAIANRIELSPDSRFLYAAVQDAAVRGVAEIDTQTDQVTRYLQLDVNRDVPSCLGLSPTGSRLFVVTMDRWIGIPSSIYMISISSWQILSSHLRSREPESVRIEGCPAFRPDGRVVFVPRNADVDVYLNRE
jgi:DNA-binding beta-propeller fold protein YncE